MKANFRIVRAPSPDVRITSARYDSYEIDPQTGEHDMVCHDKIGFHITNQAGGPISSSFIKCELINGHLQEMSVGYWPMPKKYSGIAYNISVDQCVEFSELYKEMGINEESLIPVINDTCIDQKSFDAAVRKEETRRYTTFGKDACKMNEEELDNFRKCWLRHISSSLQNSVDETKGFSPKCLRKTKAVIEEIFARAQKNQPLNTTNKHMNELFADKQQGFGGIGGAG